jgi:hypothetical protein
MPRHADKDHATHLFTASHQYLRSFRSGLSFFSFSVILSNHGRPLHQRGLHVAFLLLHVCTISSYSMLLRQLLHHNLNVLMSSCPTRSNTFSISDRTPSLTVLKAWTGTPWRVRRKPTTTRPKPLSWLSSSSL